MRNAIQVAVLILAVSLTSRAESLLPKVAPLSNIFIPLGEQKAIARAIPLAGYPFIKETANGYLILVRTGTNMTVGLLPKSDQLRNPTANIDGNRLVIRPRVNIPIYIGYIPFDAGVRYDVVSESEDNYNIRYSYGDYSTICVMSKTSVVYISAADLQKEQDEAARKASEQQSYNQKREYERRAAQLEQARIRENNRANAEAKDIQLKEKYEAAIEEMKNNIITKQKAVRQRRTENLPEVKKRGYFIDSEEVLCLKDLDSESVKIALGLPDHTRQEINSKDFIYYNKVLNRDTGKRDELELSFTLDAKSSLYKFASYKVNYGETQYVFSDAEEYEIEMNKEMILLKEKFMAEYFSHKNGIRY